MIESLEEEQREINFYDFLGCGELTVVILLS